MPSMEKHYDVVNLRCSKKDYHKSFLQFWQHYVSRFNLAGKLTSRIHNQIFRKKHDVQGIEACKLYKSNWSNMWTASYN